MRPIDADGLNGEFKRRAVSARNWKERAVMEENAEAIIRADAVLGFLSEVKITIDNAPTVETDKELNEKIETYKNAYRIMSDAFENEVRKNQRPQGEWIKVKDQLPEVPKEKQMAEVLVVAKVYFVPDHVDQRNWTYVVEKATYEPKYGFYGNNVRNSNVKEWMYAPELPKRYARYVWREEE